MGVVFLHFTHLFYEKECYRIKMKHYKQYPTEVKEALETKDSRYILQFDLSEYEEELYNRHTREFGKKKKVKA